MAPWSLPCLTSAKKSDSKLNGTVRLPSMEPSLSPQCSWSTYSPLPEKVTSTRVLGAIRVPARAAGAAASSTASAAIAISAEADHPGVQSSRFRPVKVEL